MRQDEHDIQIYRGTLATLRVGDKSYVFKEKPAHVRYAICWTHQWASKPTSMQITLQENVQSHVGKEVTLPHMWDEKWLNIRKPGSDRMVGFVGDDDYVQLG